MTRFASISIDLDGIACYHAIHGLPAPTGGDAALQKGLPRFLEMMAQLELPATLFVIGRDLVHPEVASTLRQAAEQGHELANHSFSHDYRLTQQSPEHIADEIRRAGRAIERISGEAAQGFRAPGYNTSEALMQALEDQGYLYDSSIFPTPAYFALRATAIGFHALQKRKSRSLPGDLRQFIARRDSYHPRRGQLHRAGRGAQARKIRELPIATTPLLRLPFIGTNISISPKSVNKMLALWQRLSPAPIHLELHAADFIDHTDGVAPQLAQHQADLRIDARHKIDKIYSIISYLKKIREIHGMAHLARLLA